MLPHASAAPNPATRQNNPPFREPERLLGESASRLLHLSIHVPKAFDNAVMRARELGRSSALLAQKPLPPSPRFVA